ncbi:homeobox and leucine zipper encoding b isoform X2 [Notolabrus celidotus]|uniref:homeobox and leucine zipper encoding b isoform X2 n=1 Tax=Notolabrus celidotus TaxID=1203425 RepID=UPI00148FD276|nr:homeobox and leucine zipper encoding b isoform X2 [Notolabrus celidotus]
MFWNIMQTADRGLPELIQETPDAPQGNLPEMYPKTFNPNQSGAVSLPLVSDSQRLIWVPSNQFEPPLNVAVELGEAFNRFPYLTQKETTALAQHCSLHLDQVKLWFMEQRLRYGISWDYKDILTVRSKFKSNQGKEELQKRTGEERKRACKREVGVSGGKKVRQECKKEKSANKRGLSGENERMERKMNQGEPMKKEKGEKAEEDKKNTRKKRKRVIETGKMEEKGIKQGEFVEMERQKSVQLETTKRKRKAKAVWPHCKLSDSHTEPLRRVDADPSSTPDMCTTSAKVDPTADANTIPAKPSYSAKTKAQVAMMRNAFLQCQYPANEDYNQLSMLIGISRNLLVRWYGDTRYHVKKGWPRWLSQEQCKRVSANIKYRQYLHSVMKIQPFKVKEKIVWEEMLGGRENSGES